MDSDNEKENLLRIKAEEILQKKLNNEDNSFDDNEYVHELHVHQIELQIQNEELREAQIKLEKSRQNFIDLFNSAPIGYFTIDKNGLILSVNLEGSKLIGVERLKLQNKAFIRFIDPDCRNKFHHHCIQVRETGNKETVDLKLLENGENSFYAHLETVVIPDGNGNIKEFRITATDINDIKNTEKNLKKFENYNEIFFNNHTVMLLIDPFNLKIIDANIAASNFYGYTTEQLVKMKISDLNVLDDGLVKGNMQKAMSKQENHFIFKHRLSNGDVRDVDVYSGLIDYEDKKLLYSIIHDITPQKKAEFERETTIEFLRIVNESRNVEELIQSTLGFFKEQSGCEAVGIRTRKGDDFPYFEARGFPQEFIELENFLCEYDSHGKPVYDSEGNPVIECMCGNIICGRFDATQPSFTNNGSFWTNSTTQLLKNTAEDEEQTKTRNQCIGEGYESVALIPLHSGVNIIGLLQLNDKRKNIFSSELISIWERLAGYLSIALAKFQAEEEIIRQANILNGLNQLFEESLMYETEEEVVAKSLEIAEELTGSEFGFFGLINKNGRLDDRALSPPAWDKCRTPNASKILKNMEIVSYWGRTIKEGKSQIVNDPNSDPDRRGLPKGHPPINSFLGVPLKESGKTIGMIALANKKSGYTAEDKENIEALSVAFVEVFMRKRAEIGIKENLNKLAQSNKELEQFAYITSHDLREPLRMITSFLQLLEQRYKDQLDQDAKDFIGFAVDGAKRLDAMTNDLLKYSKITNTKRAFIPVNFEDVLDKAILNLKIPIEENNVVISHDPLPTINGDEQLNVQLFQNLIGNAIKYRRREVPKIKISSTRERNQYLFSIKDNGIGMSPEHLEQIFTIFKRLHTHEEYEGTGIGLSIAQKIVHQQGGQIWAASKAGEGSTFYFTIPIN